MNLFRYIRVFCVGAVAGLVWIQPVVTAGSERQARRPDAARDARVGAGEADTDRPIERWMRMLERRNPEEHARMVRLSKEDPEAFRAALRERLAEMRRAYEARTGERLSPEDRRNGPRSPRGPEHRRFGRDAQSDPRLTEIEQHLAGLARRYHAVPTRERDAIREEMKQVLGEWADVQFEQAEERIHRMEEQLERLRQSLNERRERKDTTIRGRMEDLLEIR